MAFHICITLNSITIISNKIHTCAGAAINPTEIPANTLPTSKSGCDDAKAITIHPKTKGKVAIISAGLRPNRSINGPEANDPNGEDKL